MAAGNGKGEDKTEKVGSMERERKGDVPSRFRGNGAMVVESGLDTLYVVLPLASVFTL